MSLDATERFAPDALQRALAHTRDLLQRVHSRTLNNGARLHILQDGAHGIACLEVWIRVGSGDEPKEKAGISHLLEHLMFRGTKQHPDGEFDELIEERGVQANAWTWYDTTAYTATLPREALREVMELETDRLQGLDITQEVFDTEREVVLNERSLTADSDPNALAQEHLDRMLFEAGPYAHPVIGYRENIAGLTREDILAWYQTHYAPSALDIIVTGDIDEAQVVEMAEATFGTLSADRSPAPERPNASGAVGVGKEERIELPVAAPSLMIAWPHPKRQQIQAIATFKVLAELLAWSRGGALRDALEYNAQIVLQQNFYLNEHRLGHSALWEASPREGLSTDALAEHFFETMRAFSAEPPSQSAIDAAQLRLLTLLSARSTPWQLARALGGALHDGGALDSVERDLVALGAVSAADVQSLAKRLAARSNAIILHVLPQKS